MELLATPCAWTSTPRPTRPGPVGLGVDVQAHGVAGSSIGGARGELGAVGQDHGDLVVVRMQVFFHRFDPRKGAGLYTRDSAEAQARWRLSPGPRQSQGIGTKNRQIQGFTRSDQVAAQSYPGSARGGRGDPAISVFAFGGPKGYILAWKGGTRRITVDRISVSSRPGPSNLTVA